jgi:hypothetical protein
MTNQTLEQTLKKPPTGEIVGTFLDQESALKAQRAIRDAGVMAQRVSVEGYTSPHAQIDAQGTTIGGEVGFWLGASYGGVLGLVVVLIMATWTSLAEDSTLSRLIILGFTVVGAVAGIIQGKINLAKQPMEEKEKGNAAIPHSFCIRVMGSASDRDQARKVISEMGGAPGDALNRPMGV